MFERMLINLFMRNFTFSVPQMFNKRNDVLAQEGCLSWRHWVGKLLDIVQLKCRIVQLEGISNYEE